MTVLLLPIPGVKGFAEKIRLNQDEPKQTMGTEEGKRGALADDGTYLPTNCRPAVVGLVSSTPAGRTDPFISTDEGKG